jgi:hypothetical protein
MNRWEMPSEILENRKTDSAYLLGITKIAKRMKRIVTCESSFIPPEMGPNSSRAQAEFQGSRIKIDFIARRLKSLASEAARFFITRGWTLWVVAALGLARSPFKTKLTYRNTGLC